MGDFVQCLQLHDGTSRFPEWGDSRLGCEFGFQNCFSARGLKNDVELISFSRFSEQEGNVDQKSGPLTLMKVVLNSV